MADVTPFRGIRYSERVALDDVVAPPYDVLSAAQAAALRARSPFNAVHVDLPVPPGAAADDAAYEAAAARFRAWRQDGVLERDREPGVYLVDQTYTGPDGRERRRRGFVARLRLADFSERVVLPHERTHAGPKVDRLRLYRATRADLSTIFVLFPDDDGSAGRALAAAAGAADPGTAREARDGDGNRHVIVPVGGPAAAAVVASLAGRPLYIADGHHRYETALAYRDERRAAGDHDADTLMVYLCSLEDPGLTVFPTHRLVRGVATPPLAELLERLRPWFAVESAPVAGAAACREALERLPEYDEPGAVLGLYAPGEAACAVVRARTPEATERLVGLGRSETGARVPAALLDDLVLREALGIDPEHAEDHVDYAKSVADAFAAFDGGGYVLGAFLNATGVDQVRAVADRGEVMPQKSTYFYPKLLTGLVYDALGD